MLVGEKRKKLVTKGIMKRIEQFSALFYFYVGVSEA
mgnify:CR=1 FL=1